jgi:hypothetical protein
MNMVEILFTHYEDGKVRPAETFSGIGRGVIKEHVGGGDFNYDIL